MFETTSEGQSEAGVTFRFIHTANLLLDVPFRDVMNPSGPMTALLRDASIRTLAAITELAVERDVSFVLVAGSTWEGPTAGSRAASALSTAASVLHEHGIRLVLAAGARDGLEELARYELTWPDSITAFAESTARVLHVDNAEGERIASIVGLSSQAADGLHGLEPAVAAVDAPLGIGLLSSSDPGRNTDAITDPRSALPDDAIGYWALGGRSRSQLMEPSGLYGAWCVDPGSAQGRSLRPWDRGPKGAVVATWDDGDVSVEAVDLAAVHIDHVDLDVSDHTSVDATEDHLLTQLSELTSAANGRATAISARLSGTGNVVRSLALPTNRSDLLRRLRARSEREFSEAAMWARIDVHPSGSSFHRSVDCDLLDALDHVVSEQDHVNTRRRAFDDAASAFADIIQTMSNDLIPEIKTRPTPTDIALAHALAAETILANIEPSSHVRSSSSP